MRPSDGEIRAALKCATVAVLKWAELCDKQLQFYLGWAFPLGIPGDLGDDWFRFVTNNQMVESDYDGMLNWNEIFNSFSEQHVVQRSDYRMQLGIHCEP